MTAAKTQVLDQVDAQLRAISEQLDVLREFNREVDRLEQTGFWRRYENLTPNVVMKMNDMKFEPTGATSFAMMGRVESWLEEFDQDEIRINLRAGPFLFAAQVFFHGRRLRTSHLPRPARQASPCNQDSLPFLT